MRARAAQLLLSTNPDWIDVESDLSSAFLSSEVRAAGANRYANNKDRRAKKIINDKKLDIDFKAITFGTYGAFGKSTHSLIKKATADA